MSNKAIVKPKAKGVHNASANVPTAWSSLQDPTQPAQPTSVFLLTDQHLAMVVGDLEGPLIVAQLWTALGFRFVEENCRRKDTPMATVVMLVVGSMPGARAAPGAARTMARILQRLRITRKN